MDSRSFTRQQETACLCRSSSGQQSWGTKVVQNYETDFDLVKEMNELSVKEREKVLEEIHGVAEEQEETPEFVANAMEKMDSAIANLPRTKRRALDRANFLYPNLQNDKKFKLMFLRADYFDGSKAARRMAKYFEDKLYLFGEEKLVKKITLEDLGEKAREMFESDFCLELPQKDPTGRPIWFFDPSNYDTFDIDNLLRSGWYQMMATFEDDVAQKKGVVNITYFPGDILTMPKRLSGYPEFVRRIGDTAIGLPIRVSSYHFCYEDSRLKPLLSIIQKYFGKHIRLRVRAHFGSPLEIEYSLMTFGVSINDLMQPDNRAEKQKLRKEYINARIEKEKREAELENQKEKESGIIMHPSALDVLVGRGRPYQDYHGNRLMARLVDAHLDRYWKCSNRFEKKDLYTDIVKIVQNSGGRFIERNPNGWVVVPDKVAREKVSSGFRSKVSNATNLKGDTENNLPDRSAKRVKLL